MARWWVGEGVKEEIMGVVRWWVGEGVKEGIMEWLDGG